MWGVRYLTIVLALVVAGIALAVGENFGWSDAELNSLRSLWIGSLPAVPRDPSNRVADDPRGVKLGHVLFFDARFSLDGTVSCATCHQPQLGFTDGNTLAEGIGTTKRNAPSIVGAAYSTHQFWDGRADSLWSQALGPMESSVEHGTNRIYAASLMTRQHRKAYEALFGPIPEAVVALSKTKISPAAMSDANVQRLWASLGTETQLAVDAVFTNAGKAIAAYERQLKPGSSRFDEYARAILDNGDSSGLLSLNADETAGLKLFMGKAGCVQCHSGPRLTDDGFHNTGVPQDARLPAPDEGRSQGLEQWLENEFNCLSKFSDAATQCQPSELSRLSELKEKGLGAFKTPSLRNLAQTAPYMHAGQFETLRQVVEHYNKAAPGPVGTTELKALNLTQTEISQLVSFLETLKSEANAPLELLRAPKP